MFAKNVSKLMLCKFMNSHLYHDLTLNTLEKSKLEDNSQICKEQLMRLLQLNYWQKNSNDSGLLSRCFYSYSKKTANQNTVLSINFVLLQQFCSTIVQKSFSNVLQP